MPGSSGSSSTGGGLGDRDTTSGEASPSKRLRYSPESKYASHSASSEGSPIRIAGVVAVTAGQSQGRAGRAPLEFSEFAGLHGISDGTSEGTSDGHTVPLKMAADLLADPSAGEHAAVKSCGCCWGRLQARLELPLPF